MLESLARWSYRRRWQMVGLWVAFLVMANVLAGTVGGDYANDFSLPGTESQAAYDMLSERFPQQSGDTATVVFSADGGLADPSVQSRADRILDRLRAFPHVVSLERAADMRTSPDGRIGFATMQLDVTGDEVPPEQVKEMLDVAEEGRTDGLVVELGGAVIQFGEFEEPEGAETVGFLAAILILLVTFGSLLATALPLMTALFGIGISLALIVLSAHWLSVPDFTPQLASMIGIGVGIDYALFIVTRYRQHLHDGSEPQRGVVTAITTAGRAVIFAGLTVVISFLGILLMGFEFVEGVAVGGAAAVAVTMLASVTLLPAVLGFVGKNIDRLHVPRLLHRDQSSGTPSLWFRWSRLVQRRPWPVALAGLAVLVALSLPLFSLRLGTADAGTGKPDRSSRRAYDLLAEGFGPGFNGPLLLAADLSAPGAAGRLDEVRDKLARVPGVAAVTPPVLNPGGDAAVIQVIPTTSPQNPATDRLVHRLRDEAVPAATAGTGLKVLVGGVTAGSIDFAEKSGDRLPWLIGVVLLVSFLLLVAVFRSVVVPLKAVVMNLLSIGAAYGVIVAIFQWGWLRDVVGVETAPIEAWVPMMLFTILFGLSMDYEIFLLSRIREDYLRRGDNGLAVANGLASTARVITAAAAIMITVFLSFVVSFDERAIKLFGLGLAVAVLIDATLVRMILVPATMELLGDANWWMPKWLSRALPRIRVEPIEEEDEELLDEVVGAGAGQAAPRRT